VSGEDAPASIAGFEDALLALNNDHAQELSLLDRAGLDALLAEAFYARRIGGLDAALIAFDQTAAYQSPNYLWFRRCFDRYVYVDRVVVAPHARGRGVARALYEDLFQAALADGHDVIVCEVNRIPPNPASDAFHAALGFDEVGQAEIYGGAKTVRYLARRLQPDSSLWEEA
jgi:predicted GNAT superfamily acetyltransferase